MSGGKSSRRGTPQGGVISPLLANIYMNRFLKHWRLSGCSEGLRAHVVAYADDFVILSRGHAAEALAWSKAVMTRLGLTLNEAKTSLKDARQEHFDFLGYAFGPHYYKANGQWYLGASPSKKSVRRFKMAVRKLLVPGNHDPWPEVCDRLNSSTSMNGSATSSPDGTRWQVVAAVSSPAKRSMGSSGCCAWNACSELPAVCLAKKPVGEPDAGNPHVRFDERGEETECCP
jgi:RNA-directed DNA polymerase